jgi:Zn ribbon nucleic-acid-binding protein
MIAPTEPPTESTRGPLCPACRRPGNRVLYSRLQTDSRIRVRECIRCGWQWRTEERTLPGEEIDRNGRTVRSVDLADFVSHRQ